MLCLLLDHQMALLLSLREDNLVLFAVIIALSQKTIRCCMSLYVDKYVWLISRPQEPIMTMVKWRLHLSLIVHVSSCASIRTTRRNSSSVTVRQTSFWQRTASTA